MQFFDLDLDKTYSYADYLKWEFEERVELIKGKIFKMLSFPGTAHQIVLGNILGYLWNYLKGKPCQVFAAPFDVRLTRIRNEQEILTVVQPDICVVCDSLKIDTKGCLGAPDIVVEILSPGNNRKELKNKYEVYQEAEVKEYWIVHPSEMTFFRYILDDNKKFQPTRLLGRDDEVTTSVLPGFVLKLEEVFENL